MLGASSWSTNGATSLPRFPFVWHFQRLPDAQQAFAMPAAYINRHAAFSGSSSNQRTSREMVPLCLTSAQAHPDFPHLCDSAFATSSCWLSCHCIDKKISGYAFAPYDGEHELDKPALPGKRHISGRVMDRSPIIKLRRWVRIYGTSVVPTRKPRSGRRSLAVLSSRLAARRSSWMRVHEPPRTMWRLQSPVLHAELLVGAP
jgi:hypothetical protein